MGLHNKLLMNTQPTALAGPHHGGGGDSGMIPGGPEQGEGLGPPGRIPGEDFRPGARGSSTQLWGQKSWFLFCLTFSRPSMYPSYSSHMTVKGQA